MKILKKHEMAGNNRKFLSFSWILPAFFLFPLISTANTYSQEPEKTISLEESCELEADRLQRVLDLADWQAFYVDSILKHDYAAMRAEYEQLQKEKVSGSHIYQNVQDKWMDSIDKAYRKIFNDEQWALYLKQGAARMQKAREKRKLKASKALNINNSPKK